MQGRLAEAPNNGDLDWFPDENWNEEFGLAKELGFGSIELVFDRGCISSNPLRTKCGRKQLRKEFLRNALIPYSCCLNFIIDNSIKNSDIFVLCEESMGFLEEVGINLAILPLFDKSDFNTSDIRNELINLAKVAERHNIKILIESNERASNILKFLNSITSSCLGVVYDIGNASFCGHNIEEELLLLKEKIAHIHVKDKTLSGDNVPLGSGLVNFNRAFRSISKIQYEGMFTLETCRGVSSLISAKRNLDFLKKYMISFGLEVDYEL